MSQNLVVYLGYPNDLMAQPAPWTNTLFKVAAEGQPFSFFVSGGRITDSLREELRSRDALARLEFISSVLSRSYAGRLVPALAKEKVETIAEMASGPAETELRVLADLWVLSRADVYVVDCDAVGRGRCGVETLYADLLGLETIGVTGTPIMDPWYHYHLGRIVKPHAVLDHLWQIRASLRVEEVVEDADLAENAPHEEETEHPNS